jgi:hypothetical protein
MIVIMAAKAFPLHGAVYNDDVATLAHLLRATPR